MLLIMSISYMQTLPPKLFGEGINRIVQGLFNQSFLIETILIILGLTILIYLFNYLKDLVIVTTGHQAQYELRKNYLNHLLSLDSKFYEDYLTGDLMARATGDLGLVSGAVSHIIATITVAGFIIIFTVMSMFGLSVELTAYTIIPLPIITLLIMLFRKKMKVRYKKIQESFGELNNQVLETVTNVRVIRAFVQEEQTIDKLVKADDELFEKQKATMIIDSLYNPLFRLVFLIAYTTAIGYGAFLVFNGRLTPGELVTFNIYIGMLGWPLFAIGDSLVGIQQASVAYNRLEEVLNYHPCIKDSEMAIQMSQFETLTFDSVSFKYPKDHYATITNISFVINKGETVGIVGKTGSGKSTLVRQLLRQFPIDEGDILINGHSISQIELSSLRHLIGYVPQDHILFSRNVKGNIEMGKLSANEVEIEKAIDAADFRKDLQFLQNGLDTMVGEDGVMLSGGQKQRLSIARALVKDPEILILDDSLSAVDGKTENNIIKNLKTLRQDKTNIIIAHRLSAVRDAHQIIVLDKGKIVEMGTHDDLIAKKGWYYEQYQFQQLQKEEGEDIDL
jgi:ATP-binding cassette, subfamily B, multidrug efflux pump